jgi:hypothetical protein
MECKRCLFTHDIAKLGEHQCEYCDIHDTLERQSRISDLQPQLNKIKKSKGKYNCIMGISGGLDSSALLWMAARVWKLKPLVIHFDNNYNKQVATDNMNNLISKLGVDAIVYRVNKGEYDDLNKSFIHAGVPDADIPNDIAMTKLMYDTADKYGIKYILNGHDFREEGSTPRAWTYMDAEYIRSVYRWYTGKELVNYPLFTFKDQLYYAFKGIKNIRPFHYGFNRKKYEELMTEEIGWQSYGGKHAENVYTEFVGNYLLPRKFNIDKRIVYLSALVRSGLLTKEVAREKLSNKPHFDPTQVGYSDTELMDIPINDRKVFKSYDFKKYRPLIWVLAKFKVVPYTFYKKYCF